MSISLYIYICLSLYLSVYLSIYLNIYLFVGFKIVAVRCIVWASVCCARYAVTNKTSGRRLVRYLDLGPSMLSIVSNDGVTEKHKYAYRELKIRLVDVRTVELDRGSAGTYM